MDVFGTKSVIGMVHLLPLPGSPRFCNTQKILDQAVTDYHALKNGGVDGILIENYGDAPYFKTVSPHTVSWMTKIILSLNIDLPFGVNVLRNDAVSALAVAHATGGKFIRCNILSGVMVTDQGIIEGKAADVLRYRSTLQTDIKIFADVLVKHGSPLVNQPLVRAVKDTVYRALADAVIVTGSETGEPPLIQDLSAVKAAVPDAYLFAGSGITADNVQSIFAHADGCIIGKAFKKEGKIENPVEEKRVKAIMKKVKEIRKI